MIIFDCDGVLVDSEIISNEADAAAFTSLGYPITAEEMIRRFIGRPKKDIWADVEKEFGRPFPADLLDRVTADIKARYHSDLKPVAGVAAAIDAIGGQRCVASSSEMEKLRLALSVTGLAERFDPFIFSASQVKRGKPAPDLFLFAAARMGKEPANCIVVEDSPAGVTAGRAAGMPVIGFTGGAHSFPGHADTLREAGAALVVEHMDALPAAVEGLRAGG